MKQELAVSLQVESPELSIRTIQMVMALQIVKKGWVTPMEIAFPITWIVVKTPLNCRQATVRPRFKAQKGLKCR